MPAAYIHIKGIPISLPEAKIIVCLIYGYSHKQIADFLEFTKKNKKGKREKRLYKVSTISTMIKGLHKVLEVGTDRLLVRLAQKYGFDNNGLYKGKIIIRVPEII